MKLIKICLIISIIGLISLYFLSINLDIEEVDEINHANAGEIVKIRGKIVDVKENEKTANIKLSSQVTNDIFLFKDRNLSIPIGAYVTIEGEVEEDQFIAHKIELI